MGWSCSVAASDVEKAWSNMCLTQTGLSNTFRSGNRTYFYEVDSVEHPDGSITGNVFRLAGDLAHEAGTFKIDGQGKVDRAPAFLRRVKVCRSECGPRPAP